MTAEAPSARAIAKIFLTVLGLALLVYLIYLVRATVGAVLIAGFLAVALGPAVDFFHRRRVPRGVAILIVYMLISAGIFGVGLLIVPPIASQVQSLSNKLPSYLDDLRHNKQFRKYDNKYKITQKLNDQARKLPIIADARSVLEPTLGASPPVAPITAGQIRMAAGLALANIEPALRKLPPAHPLARVAEDLRTLKDSSDAESAWKLCDDIALAANAALTRFLPEQLDRLRMALGARPVGRADIPPAIARDWLLPDGRARLQVVPKQGTSLEAFTAAVTAVAPMAGGSAVTIAATSETIVTAFRTAAIGAVVAILVILGVTLRRPLDVALVIAPLLLSALLTLYGAVLLRQSLNFANIIALPLLLGVGVSFNVYFVMNWRAGGGPPLGSATARAVMFSALTTATAFGSLALSGHPGTASMGVLLLISLGCTLVASLVFVPAILAVLGPPRGG